MPAETESLSQLLAFLRPGVALTPASAKKLAWDLRKIAKRCERFASGVVEHHGSADAPESVPGAVKRKKSFDFDRFSNRYVAFRLMYIGWRYHGFTLQDNIPNTVEASLFSALQKACLIRPGLSNKEMNYTRCGRTDIGVSALANVVTLELRSKASKHEPLPAPEEELDYPLLLNQILPDDIQITGWTPVPEDCNARFSATYRQYKYFFSGCQSLDAHAMQTAANYLVGLHDFQHFCKVNFSNTTNHQREILSAQVLPHPLKMHGNEEVLELVVRGSGFLWHQVRCIAEILRMVGMGLEKPEVIKELLDIDKTPGRPRYPLASETPLLLHSAGYPEHLLPPFRLSQRAARNLRKKIHRLTQEQVGKLSLMYEVDHNISQIVEKTGAVPSDTSQHQPLMQRSRDVPVAERLREYLAKHAQRAAASASDGSGNNGARCTVAKRERSLTEQSAEELSPMETMERV